MHRVLAVLIALLLGGGVVAAVVKSGDEGTKPVVQQPPGGSPSETFSPAESPTEGVSETPTEAPSETFSEEPTASPTELAHTGDGSVVPAALLSLAIAAGAGVSIARTRRSAA